MDANPENLNALSNYLRQTMSPDASARKPAEQFLQKVEVEKNHLPPIFLDTRPGLSLSLVMVNI